MTKGEAAELYELGTPPTVDDLQGDWDVTMLDWKWRLLMPHDVKSIHHNKGFNTYFILGMYGILWGWFRIQVGTEDTILYYEDGTIIDHLRRHPGDPNIMIGKFCRRMRDRPDKFIAYFILARTGEEAIPVDELRPHWRHPHVEVSPS